MTVLKRIHDDIDEEEVKFQRVRETLRQQSTEEAKEKVREETSNERMIRQLDSIEVATRPSEDAVKRSQFKSPHRQYAEKKKQTLLLNEIDEVKILSNWSSSCDPNSSTTTSNPWEEQGRKQFYTYQTRDGCLIFHERPQEKEAEETRGDNHTDGTKIIQVKENTLEWKEITAVDLSDVKKRDPKNFTILSGDCSPKKKVLCWKTNDDSSGSDEEGMYLGLKDLEFS